MKKSTLTGLIVAAALFWALPIIGKAFVACSEE